MYVNVVRNAFIDFLGLQIDNILSRALQKLQTCTLPAMFLMLQTNLRIQKKDSRLHVQLFAVHCVWMRCSITIYRGQINYEAFCLEHLFLHRGSTS